MREHIRSNIVGYLALFVALGGTAAALPGKNTVDSGDITNGQVKTKDIGAGQVRGSAVADDTTPYALTGIDIADESLTGNDVAADSLNGSKIANGSIGGGDVGNDSLTGADIDEASLGQVPSAATAVLAGYGRSFSGTGCNPTGAAFIDCGFLTLNLPAQSRVLLMGSTRGYLGGFGYCRLVTSAGVLSGTDVGVHSDDVVALNAVTGPLGGGSIDVGIECQQTAGFGDIAYEEVRLSAVAISPG